MDRWFENWVSHLSEAKMPIEKKTLLLIDDHIDISENFKECLELERYCVKIARDDKQGLDMAMSLKPDLIVCDVLMPGINGYELLRQIMLSSLTQQIPFIFSSSFSEKVDKTEALLMGADDYLIKPFETEILLIAIEALLKSGSKRKSPELISHLNKPYD